MTNSIQAYSMMFKNYPDLLEVKDVHKILGVSSHYVYQMIANKELFAVKLGKAYKISKIRLIEYLIGENRQAC